MKNMPAGKRVREWGMILIVALPPTGCSQWLGPPRSDERVIADRVSEEELRSLLDEFEDSFEAEISRASDELAARDPSRRTRKLLLLWQMRLIPMARAAENQKRPVAAFLDLWLLTMRMRQYFEEGDGRDLFGPNQFIALNAAKKAEQGMHDLAPRIMSTDMAAAARQRVEKLARSRPLRAEFSGGEVSVVAEAGPEDNVVRDVLSIPLVPFRALQGVDRTAQAVKDFTVVADRLTDVVQGLAADARLHLQLLLLETEDLEMVQSSLASFDRLSRSTQAFAETAQALPRELRIELTQWLNDADAKQAAAQATLKDTRSAAENVARAGEALAAAAAAIQQMVASFRQPAAGAEPSSASAPSGVAPASTETDGRPFDILDYAATADACAAAAREFQMLAGDIRALGASPEVTGRLDDLERRISALLTQASAKTDALADHAAARLFQIILAVFVLAIIYRYVAARLVATATRRG